MKRIVLVACWILAFAMIASAQTTFYFAHVADGVQGSGAGAITWKTTIFLTNPSSSGTASGTITFQQDTGGTNLGQSGTVMNIGFVDENGTPVSAPIAFSISGGQTKKYVSTGASAYVGSGGFATVSTNAGIVSGTAVFSEFNSNGQLVAEAGVPQASGSLSQAIFVDSQGGYNIAVAYANPGTTSATISLKLLNAPATQTFTTTQTLGPGNHAAIFASGASFLNPLFPAAGQVAGTMQITSGSPIAAIALRFDPTLRIFSTLPPVQLSSVFNPAIRWLEERPWLAPLTTVARLLGAFQMRV